MKEDLAGGKLPSGDFGVNAAWWWIMILALNLNAAMKRLALGGSWVSKRLKAVRFALINLAGRVLERSRTLIIRLSGGHPSFEILLAARRNIAAMAAEPARPLRSSKKPTKGGVWANAALKPDSRPTPGGSAPPSGRRHDNFVKIQPKQAKTTPPQNQAVDLGPLIWLKVVK